MLGTRDVILFQENLRVGKWYPCLFHVRKSFIRKELIPEIQLFHKYGRPIHSKIGVYSYSHGNRFFVRLERVAFSVDLRSVLVRVRIELIAGLCWDEYLGSGQVGSVGSRFEFRFRSGLRRVWIQVWVASGLSSGLSWVSTGQVWVKAWVALVRVRFGLRSGLCRTRLDLGLGLSWVGIGFRSGWGQEAGWI